MKNDYYYICPKCKEFENLIICNWPPWRAECSCGFKGYENDCEKMYRIKIKDKNR